MKYSNIVRKESHPWLTNVKICSLFLFIILSACNPLTPNQDALQETLIALGVQQTSLYQTISAPTIAVDELTSIDQSITSTPDQFATQSLSTEASMSIPSSTPDIDVIDTVPTIDPEIERKIKSAKILLFEDMSASGEIRIVKEALDQAGYYYLDVGSALGWFKDRLQSGEDWDLIIAAAEARRGFGGEYLDYINEKVEEGASAIIEYYDFDVSSDGKAKRLLDNCGIIHQLDWFEPDLRVIYWLQQDHPILHTPNEMPAQIGNASMWKLDIGDLFEIRTQNGVQIGDAKLLAGTNGAWKDDHGLLVSCVEGRLIIQSFGSHDYRYIDMLPLWQNYIYNSLANNTKLMARVSQENILDYGDNTVSRDEPVEASGLGNKVDCSGIMTIRVDDLPTFRKSLFEHHASGTFLLVDVFINNNTNKSVQIWGNDYSIESDINEEVQVYSPHKAATGYLYNEFQINLSQDRIQPDTPWQTKLAFDVDPDGVDWVLVIKPGSVMGKPICEVRIPLIK